MHQILRFEKQILAACEKHLRDVLDLLSCKIECHVILVGVDAGSMSVLAEDGYAANFEIEKHFSHPQQFPLHPSDDLEEVEWYRGYQAYDMQCGEWWGEIQDAVKHAINGQGLLSSVSPTVEVNGKVVALVAIFSETDLMKYPTVTMDVFTNHGRWPSLQFGVIEAVLNQFAEELDKRNPGREKGYEPLDSQQTLRVAGDFFMRMHSRSGNLVPGLDIHYRGALKLFDACNIIASFPYEKREGLGGMIIADPAHPAIDTVLKYKLPMLLNHHRRVRKMLEMCSGGLSILCDSRYAWGLGRFDKTKYDPSKMEICTVEFKGHHHWQMSHLGTTLMDVRYGNPGLPQPPVKLDIVRSALAKQFGVVSNSDILCEIVKIAAQSHHGAVVVISKNAANECERIAGMFGIRPFDFDENALCGAMSIDGAIMVDPQGVCHGVGLILDGNLAPNEDPSRGARFNSVTRYINTHPDCVIVVVSEDGMVNVFPDQETNDVYQVGSTTD
ncbi:hypothetical protein Pla110_07760 [Polystyrenella longa]|uniref:DAC domain-containing protein n=1 Tax=Polystyrenella longa TaxID=2528007 RepID=A0A518CIM2_9PLAN|nr:diadenylate cyclase [Polystyrenella longa]QDU79072.1 hypothetical protein Pla110_07760 [Polystyrenella longa]